MTSTATETTMISDRFYSAAPELRVTIEDTGARGSKGRFIVTHHYGCTADGIYVGYGSAGRATLAEARELANAFWSHWVALINRRRAMLAGQAENAPADVPAAPVTEPGMYRDNGGSVFRVVEARERDENGNARLYAKFVNPDTGQHEYSKGAIFVLTADMRMSADEVAELSLERKWTHCGVCGRELTNAESVRLGIGPICRAKV